MANPMPPVRAKRKPRRLFVRYGECSLAELRRFLKDRTGVDFDRKTNRVKLTARLRELDRNRTFPLFNELPPEIRLRVYDLLLAPDEKLRKSTKTHPSGSSSVIHTALLRTSKAIYAEAKRVLYNGNRFKTVLKFGQSGFWTLEVECPGRNLPFTDFNHDDTYSWVLHCKAMTSISRGLKRVTIKLDLGQSAGHANAWKACRIIARLCLFMCGDSALEELTFSLAPHDGSPEVTVSMLPHIFWPTILLQSKVVVRFEGVSGILGSQQSEQSQQPEHSERESQRAMLPTGTAEGLCKLVAKIRHRCEVARIKASSDEAILPTPINHENDAISDSSSGDRFNIYKGAVKNKGIWIGELVRRLAPLAEIVDTVDIASGSTRWKLLQALADDAARFEGKRSPWSLASRSKL
jgi:hypothetical protein